MTSLASPPAEPETQKIRPTLATPFSHDQLEAHAVSLARAHRVELDPSRGKPLLPRLDKSADRLEQAYRFLSSIARTDPQPVGSEDWLRDNYHVVQDQIREIRQDLPRKYYIELPKLADGPFAGYPRVYLIARELVTHTAGRLDLETLVDFVTAYQTVSPLSIGEIWAIPIMLRLALVEELRRLADGILAARLSREHARRWETLSGGRGPRRAHRESPRRRTSSQPPSHCRLRRRTAAVAARPAVDGRSGVDGAAARTRGAGGHGRRAAAQRASARGGRPARHGKHDHQHAAAVVERLAGVLRPRQSRREGPPRRSGGRVRGDGLSHARPLPALDRRAVEGGEAAGDRGGAPGGRVLEACGRDRSDQRPTAPRRLLPHLAWALHPGRGSAVSAEPARTFLPLLFQAPRPRLPRNHRRDGDPRSGQPPRLRRAARGDARRAVARRPGGVDPDQRAGDQPDPRGAHIPDSAAATAEAGDARRDSGERSNLHRRTSHHRFRSAHPVPLPRSRGAVPGEQGRQPALRAAQRLS